MRDPYECVAHPLRSTRSGTPGPDHSVLTARSPGRRARSGPRRLSRSRAFRSCRADLLAMFDNGDGALTRLRAGWVGAGRLAAVFELIRTHGSRAPEPP